MQGGVDCEAFKQHRGACRRGQPQRPRTLDVQGDAPFEQGSSVRGQCAGGQPGGTARGPGRRGRVLAERGRDQSRHRARV